MCIRDSLYTVCPDLTEPVLDPYYETNLRNAEEQLAQLQKAYDEAEPIDKQMCIRDRSCSSGRRRF